MDSLLQQSFGLSPVDANRFLCIPIRLTDQLLDQIRQSKGGHLQLMLPKPEDEIPGWIAMGSNDAAPLSKQELLMSDAKLLFDTLICDPKSGSFFVVGPAKDKLVVRAPLSESLSHKTKTMTMQEQRAKGSDKIHILGADAGKLKAKEAEKELSKTIAAALIEVLAMRPYDRRELETKILHMLPTGVDTRSELYSSQLIKLADLRGDRYHLKPEYHSAASHSDMFSEEARAQVKRAFGESLGFQADGTPMKKSRTLSRSDSMATLMSSTERAISTLVNDIEEVEVEEDLAFSKHYGKIETHDQLVQYRKEFQTKYNRYSELHQVLAEKHGRFGALMKRFEETATTSPEHLRASNELREYFLSQKDSVAKLKSEYNQLDHELRSLKTAIKECNL